MNVVEKFLKRAEEVQEKKPTVAYYCKLYALETFASGYKLGTRPDYDAFVASLMDDLEGLQHRLSLNKDKDKQELTEFALRIFFKADKQEREGEISQNTVRLFYSASVFLQVLNHFGPVAPDIAEKIKYAQHTSVKLLKFLKDGPPISEPPPPPPPPPPVPAQPTLSLPPSIPRSVPPAPPQPSAPSSLQIQQGRKKKPSDEEVIELLRYNKYISNALHYDDFDTAREYLQKSLDMLTY